MLLIEPPKCHVKLFPEKLFNIRFRTFSIRTQIKAHDLQVRKTCSAARDGSFSFFLKRSFRYENDDPSLTIVNDNPSLTKRGGERKPT